MASFTDLIAQRIQEQRSEFLAGLSDVPANDIESLLADSIQAHWHSLEPKGEFNRHGDRSQVAAVDGSHAVRALNTGADWIVAQALIIGRDGFHQSAADTVLLRGDIERPAVDRCASLLMRSLELDLALQFAQSGVGNVLLLDGSLYSDLPYLLYNLAIGGYEDLPSRVLKQYLDLFDCCQECDILLLGVAKRTRATVLGRALFDQRDSSSLVLHQADTFQVLSADVQDEEAVNDAVLRLQRLRNAKPDTYKLPSDGELLYRWTKGMGLTDPVLLGSASFGNATAHAIAQLTQQARYFVQGQDHLSTAPSSEVRDSPLLERLLAAPAIGTCYVRLAPGEDVLRVDALASAFGRGDLRLLDFAHVVASYTTALPVVQPLLENYGGLSVYNAALYVVDHEVRLHADIVDHVYLPVLQRQLGHPILYDRSTRRFIS